MERVFVRIEYNEDTKSYYKVALTGLDNEELNRDFGSGDPVQDWSDMIDYLLSKHITSFEASSSVDFFPQDVPGYKWDHSSGIARLIRKK